MLPVKPPKNPHSPDTNQAGGNLANSITLLADQIAVLREAIDELRDDFSWALNNFRPAELPQHVIVKRMAANPAAHDWNERLQLVHSGRPNEELTDELFGELVERVGTDLTSDFLTLPFSMCNVCTPVANS